jgi:predicted nucleic acid-binding protein
MEVFLDTSVLAAACVQSHPHHSRALPIVQRVTSGRERGFIASHSIAETYVALTRMPVVPRIHPAEALQIITASLLPSFQLVNAEANDYRGAMERVAAGGWAGGKIYDALLLQCALKSRARRVYTFNLRDFQQLAPPELRGAICAP